MPNDRPSGQWLLYVSRADEKVGPQEVDSILQTSRRHNERHHITGMLLYTGSHFAQALEGPAHALDVLMAAIVADPRHHGLQMIGRGPLARRRFRQWSMGYVDRQGAADLIEDLLHEPKVPPERARRLVTSLFSPASGVARL